MFRRTRPVADPVTIHLDGAPIVAERGEPLVAALLGADKATLARSAKLHRPRGPSCLRGGCDGCLARVDGEPNVMTCLRPAAGGEQIETQNFVGSRRADLLRVTDWFFPNGIDHHHLMTGVPGVSDLLVSFARKVAGLGRLPTTLSAPTEARRVEADVLVVGGGLAGCRAAAQTALAGLSTLLVDDGVEIGGSVVGQAPLAPRDDLARVRIATSTTAAGLFPGGPIDEGAPLEMLLAGPDGALVARSRALVLATGAHDGVLAVPNNDLPGVMSARALCRLLARGIEPDGPVVLVGEGFWADRLEAQLPAGELVRVAERDCLGILGSAQVRSVEIGGPARRVRAAVVAVATAPSPAFELCAQAGAKLAQAASGYVPIRDDDGSVAPGAWAAGECAGVPFQPEAVRRDAERIAASVVAALSRR